MIEGKIRHRDGKMFVVYTTTLSTEPRRRIMWWKVIEAYSNKYNMNRPEDGFTARHESGAGNHWTVSGRDNAAAGRVVVEDQADVQEVNVDPPRSGGKQLRWRDGQWEKLMAKGWVPAGEGGSGDPNRPNAPKPPRKRSAKQLQAEIDAELAGGRR